MKISWPVISVLALIATLAAAGGTFRLEGDDLAKLGLFLQFLAIFVAVIAAILLFGTLVETQNTVSAAYLNIEKTEEKNRFELSAYIGIDSLSISYNIQEPSDTKS